jgi:hypothetical protein
MFNSKKELRRVGRKELIERFNKKELINVIKGNLFI